MKCAKAEENKVINSEHGFCHTLANWNGDKQVSTHPVAESVQIHVSGNSDLTLIVDFVCISPVSTTLLSIETSFGSPGAIAKSSYS